MGYKLEILQLLENGSITAEEAERLLDTAEHEELEAFRQEMREQMAAIQNAAEDARCAAADARCAARSLIHITEPTRQSRISDALVCV